MFVEFGRFLPDQADYGLPWTNCENAIPVAKGFISVPQLATLGVTGITGIANALWYERQAGGNVYSFAGDETKLYQISSGAFVDASRAAGYTAMDTDTEWRHARYGDDLFSVNGKNDLQVFNLASGGVGGLFTDAVTQLQARYIAVVRDFLVLAFVNDYPSGEGSNLIPYRVHWSANGTPLDFTPNNTTQAGRRDIPDLGEVRGLTGGEYGTILMENGLVRMDYIGAFFPIMRLDQIEGAPGCFAPRSVIRVKNRTYWYSAEGFQMFDGQQSRAIGSERVDRFFARDIRTEDFDKISVVDVPNISVIAWGYISANSLDMKIDALLLYNYDIDEWGYAKVTGLDCLGDTGTTGFTLEELDTVSPQDPPPPAPPPYDPNKGVDGLPASLDSRLWQGGSKISGGIKTDGLYTFTGSPADAVFETNDIHASSFARGYRTGFIDRVVPAVQGGNAILTAQVGHKVAWNEDPIWGDVYAQNEDGAITPRGESGRLHRIRANVSGGWSFATGCKIEGVGTGRR